MSGRQRPDRTELHEQARSWAMRNLGLSEQPGGDLLVDTRGRTYKVKARSQRNPFSSTSFNIGHSEPSFDFLVGVMFALEPLTVAWAASVSRARFEELAHYNADSARLRLSKRGAERHAVDWLTPTSDPFPI